MDLINYAEKLAELVKSSPEELSAKIKNKIQAKIKEFNRSLLLFGTGELGRKTAVTLTAHGWKPKAFIDNNRTLQGKEILAIPIISLNEAKKRFPDSLIVVTIFTNGPVLEQLESEKREAITFAELAWAYPQWFFPFCSVDYPNKIFGCREAVLQCLKIWEDDKSREEYLGQIAWRLSLDRKALPHHDRAADTYFPNDLFEISDSEVFIDCGSYDGDTIKDFLNRTRGNYSKIIAVEPDPLSRARLLDWTQALNDESQNKISIIAEAASTEEGIVSFDTTGTVTSSLGVGNHEIHCAPLDQSAGKYHPTFIKMDIEGAEPAALKGCTNIIQNDEPILAICLYHAQEHIWEIPLLIHQLNPKYKLFLRRYSDECWESVCYAIPRSRCKS
jgi:FkbM family methyltransferase